MECGMTSRRFGTDTHRIATVVRSRLTDDLRRHCADAGISTRTLSTATGLDHGYLAEILRGEARPSLETYVRLAAALGADLSMRLYPNTGPTIRDRHQARILEWLLGALHPRWRPSTEVGVRSPVRGSIDAVLLEARERLIVATEIESELRRLEQQIRWAQEKAAAMPSWVGWDRLAVDTEPSISRLLLVRRTRATRRVAAEFSRQLAVAYPAHPDDAAAALTGTATWPGPALVWITLDAKGPRVTPGR